MEGYAADGCRLTADGGYRTSSPAVPPGRRPVGRGPREWARAFTGFYPPLAADLAELDPLLVLSVGAAAIGIYFIRLRGWPAVVLIAAGALLLWAYDAAPRALKELGLGEVAAFVVWGPLMIALWLVPSRRSRCWCCSPRREHFGRCA